MSTQNKELTRQFYEEVVNQRRIELADDMLAEDFNDHAAKSRGREQFIRLYRSMIRIFPDIRAQVRDLIAEGDKVVARVDFTATQAGSFRGFPPANRAATYSGVDIFRFSGGKIVERWALRDFLGMLEKLGHLTKR